MSQETEGKFTYSIIVSDNDCNRSAEPIVREFAHSGMKVIYDVEPQLEKRAPTLINLLAVLNDYFAKHRIEYWLDGWILLGSYRDE